MGFVYGIGNLGKFIGPAGLGLIAARPTTSSRKRRSTRWSRASTTSLSGTCWGLSPSGLSALNEPPLDRRVRQRAGQADARRGSKRGDALGQ